MKRKGRSLLVFLLFAGAGWLAVLDWRLWNAPVDTSPLKPDAMVETSSASTPHTPNTVAGPRALAELTETLARPLFNATRRPKPPAEKPAATPPSQPEAAAGVTEAPATAVEKPAGLRLVGMMRTVGQARRALIRSGENARAVWVELGDEVGGWRVDRIESDKVVVEKGTSRAELQLYAPRLPKGAVE